MANYCTIIAAAVIMVMMVQLYRLQTLKDQLHQQMTKFSIENEKMKGDISYQNQEIKSCNTYLKQENVAKEEFSQRNTKLNDALIQQDANLQKWQEQVKEIQAENQRKLEEVDAITKERDNALTEAEKYHTLNREMNKLLTAARQKCETIQGPTADTQPSARQIILGQVNNVGQELKESAAKKKDNTEVEEGQIQNSPTNKKERTQEQDQMGVKENKDQKEDAKKPEPEVKEVKVEVEKKTEEKKNVVQNIEKVVK